MPDSMRIVTDALRATSGSGHDYVARIICEDLRSWGLLRDEPIATPAGYGMCEDCGNPVTNAEFDHCCDACEAAL